ncbi:MAG: HD-GYP domain-containing protein [Oscillospiraceae bacterium]|nr:HD-GYP domain-containing protein [Oscillospiraceae bacterium]
MLIVFLQIFTLVQNRRRLDRRLTNSMILCIALPTVFSVVQIFNYGISLTNMTMVFMVIAFYIYALIDMSREMRQARKNEIESYKEAERIKEAMFEQTAEALANAIDAKDQYTHGHSTRVAALSRQIAKEAGYSEKDCEQIYFAALLHDVGKIGIRDEIINKKGRLTQEEFEQIKQHPILGYQILSSIKQSPALSVGAHYHHERFDGSGYPDGLSGESIPETARIIAVADAYDAMTSSRSYRGKLSREKTRAELIAGKGKQFDPKFADIMLHILDREDAVRI